MKQEAIMEDREKLHALEKDLVKDQFTSAATVKACRDVLSIPEIVSGMTIIDIGSGASSLTADLLERGANAFAVDHLYINSAALPAKIAEAVPKIIAHVPPEYRQHMEQVTMTAVTQFLRSYDSHPDRYVAGWFTDLPFPDNFADLIVSFNAISSMGAVSELFEASIREALRVTKPGGTFVMAPHHSDRSRHKQYRSQHSRAVELLRRENVGEITIDSSVQTYLDARLIIRKCS